MLINFMLIKKECSVTYESFEWSLQNGPKFTPLARPQVGPRI